MNITRQMIAAAHDVTMRHKIVLGHELLGEIYQAMKSASPAQRKPLTEEEIGKAVIDAARAAMDDSVEAYDSEGSIKISSHLAASLSLRLDEYDRAIEAAHQIGVEK